MPKLEPRDLFPGALEMMVLRLLQQEPLHGYALAQRIQRPSNDLLQGPLTPHSSTSSKPSSFGRRYSASSKC